MTTYQEKRRARPWIKVQLGIDSDSTHAADIVDYWRSLRMATFHLRRAIAMYYALQSGNMNLVWEYFPMLKPVAVRVPSAPVEQLQFEIEVRDAQSSEDELGDFIESLGL